MRQCLRELDLSAIRAGGDTQHPHLSNCFEKSLLFLIHFLELRPQLFA